MVYTVVKMHLMMDLCLTNMQDSIMFLSAVWTLILTAPFHCRGSIGEQAM